MARPPRGRLPDSDRFDTELGADELPLDLPRVDPVRSRMARPIVNPVAENFVSGERPLRADATLNRPRPAPRANDPYIPDPKPTVSWPERLANPFDYYAVPANTAPAEKPMAEPLAKKRGNEPVRSGEPNYVTSKYYEPRSDLTASRQTQTSDDLVDAWPSFVKSTRPIVDVNHNERVSQTQQRPVVREHDARSIEPTHGDAVLTALRHEELGSWQSAAAFSKLPSSSLASDEGSVAPSDLYADSYPSPKLPIASDDPFGSIDVAHEGRFPYLPDRNLVSRAAVDYDSDTEFDPRLRPSVTQQVLRSHEIAQAREAPIALSSGDDAVAPRIAYSAPSLSSLPGRQVPNWMRRSQQATPIAVSTSEWGQEDALSAVVERIRERSEVSLKEPRQNFAEVVLQHLRQAFGRLRNPIQKRAAQRLPHNNDAPLGTFPDFQGDLNARPDYAQGSGLSVNVQTSDVQSSLPADLRADEGHDFRIGTSAHASADLRAIRSDSTAAAFDVPPVDQRAIRSASTDLSENPNRFRSFFKRRARASTSYPLDQSDRALRRKKQARLYEDIVAWIVVPPFIIGMIYGGLEFVKFLSNSPLGKLLSGQ